MATRKFAAALVFTFLGASWGCSDGDSCRYCHLPHARTSPKPDKQRRLLLEAMTDQERLTLCLPEIKRKAAPLNLPETALVVHLLEVELASLPPPANLRKNGMLKQVISRMSFGHLVAMSMFQLPSHVRAALLALRLRMPPSIML
ncbi:unnamed protein product [Symbiodinium natans]|uniref:C3H1-type domain-containing protein n=1 Tax=Symbiodinium natans TaxID=878477 RepID=A0A812IEA2_9DINO|nr:unnamed protein product [Symbiodinium natans]